MLQWYLLWKMGTEQMKLYQKDAPIRGTSTQFYHPQKAGLCSYERTNNRKAPVTKVGQNLSPVARNIKEVDWVWLAYIRNNTTAGLVLKSCNKHPMSVWGSGLYLKPWKKHLARRHSTHRTQSTSFNWTFWEFKCWLDHCTGWWITVLLGHDFGLDAHKIS